MSGTKQTDKGPVLEWVKTAKAYEEPNGTDPVWFFTGTPGWIEIFILGTYTIYWFMISIFYNYYSFALSQTCTSLVICQIIVKVFNLLSITLCLLLKKFHAWQ